RAVARDILKVLESAAANAAQAAGLVGIAHGREREEFYSTLRVVSCFADEGPTLKRWRARARGRSARIRKRTCHITVIVDRMTPEGLAARDARAEARATTAGRPAAAASGDRRRRVERSRRKQAEREAAAAEHDHEHEHEHEHGED